MSGTVTGNTKMITSENPLSPNYDWSKAPLVRGGSYFSRKTYDKMQKMDGYVDLSPQGALELLVLSGMSFNPPNSGEKELVIGYDDAKSRPPNYLIGPAKGGLSWRLGSDIFSKYKLKIAQTPSGIVLVSLDKKKSSYSNMGYKFKIYNSRKRMPKSFDYNTIKAPGVGVMKFSDVKFTMKDIRRFQRNSRHEGPEFRRPNSYRA
ncbi:MAG: hypothetical protein AABW88_03610 [Nanoarchaeota archaeon]